MTGRRGKQQHVACLAAECRDTLEDECVRCRSGRYAATVDRLDTSQFAKRRKKRRLQPKPAARPPQTERRILRTIVSRPDYTDRGSSDLGSVLDEDDEYGNDEVEVHAEDDVEDDVEDNVEDDVEDELDGPPAKMQRTNEPCQSNLDLLSLTAAAEHIETQTETAPASPAGTELHETEDQSEQAAEQAAEQVASQAATAEATPTSSVANSAASKKSTIADVTCHPTDDLECLCFKLSFSCGREKIERVPLAGLSYIIERGWNFPTREKECSAFKETGSKSLATIAIAVFRAMATRDHEARGVTLNAASATLVTEICSLAVANRSSRTLKTVMHFVAGLALEAERQRSRGFRHASVIDTGSSTVMVLARYARATPAFRPQCSHGACYATCTFSSGFDHRQQQQNPSGLDAYDVYRLRPRGRTRGGADQVRSRRHCRDELR